MTKFISLAALSTFKAKLLDIFVKKSGDTMSGNLTVGSSTIQTNGYIEGVWLRSTANNAHSSKQSRICVQDSSGWIYSRTPDQILSDIGAATQKSYTVTIGTSWSRTSAPFTQNITVNGILATDEPIVDLITTTNNYNKEIEEYGKIFKITTSANKITVYATEKTTESLSCKLKVVR